jgi:hypothetical protein
MAPRPGGSSNANYFVSFLKTNCAVFIFSTATSTAQSRLLWAGQGTAHGGSMTLTRAQLVNPDCEVTDGDYDAIESAIMQSARGRWFLSEYMRRHRHAETELILSAINNIKTNIDSRGSTKGHSPNIADQSRGVVRLLKAGRSEKPNDSPALAPELLSITNDRFYFK